MLSERHRIAYSTAAILCMAKALDEQRRQPDVAGLSLEDRLALLVDREAIKRENKRLVSPRLEP